MTGRKILRVSAIILLVLVTCLLFIASFLSLMNSQKSSFNDSDLIYVRPDIPVASNAYWTLLKATNALYWPDKQERQLGDLIANTNWSDALAAEVLAKNSACLNLFDKAMQQPGLLVPQPKTFEDNISYAGGWRKIANVDSIRINSLHREKKDAEAFDRAFELIQFGQRIENCGGPIIHYLIGSAIKSLGLIRIRQMAANTTLTEDDLAGLIAKLDQFRPNEEGLINSLKVEYTTQCKYVDDSAKGNFPGTTNSSTQRFWISLGMKPFFSPRRTKMRFAQTDRSILKNISKPFADMDWSNLPDAGSNAPVLESLFSGNIMGDMFVQMLEPIWTTLGRAKCRENVNVTATQLLLALKIYKMRHGKIPQSLSELVPEFFPRVPTDDFDGKPFRYLPEKKIIYSVGPCLKDLGGKEPNNESEDYNLTFKIDF